MVPSTVPRIPDGDTDVTVPSITDRMGAGSATPGKAGSKSRPTSLKGAGPLLHSMEEVVKDSPSATVMFWPLPSPSISKGSVGTRVGKPVGVPNWVPVRVKASREIEPEAGSAALAGAEVASAEPRASPRAMTALLSGMTRLIGKLSVGWGGRCRFGCVQGGPAHSRPDWNETRCCRYVAVRNFRCLPARGRAGQRSEHLPSGARAGRHRRGEGVEVHHDQLERLDPELGRPECLDGRVKVQSA